MKKTKNIFAIIAMCGLLTLSACTGKDNSGTTTGTTDNSQTTTSTGSLEEINAQLDDLYQQENQKTETIKEKVRKLLWKYYYF